ncbi:hypothetical protein ACFL3V_03385 [Nanoarchaeota archaeon]
MAKKRQKRKKKAGPTPKAVKPKSALDTDMDSIETEIKRYKDAVDNSKTVAPVSVMSATKIEEESAFFRDAWASAKGLGSLSFYFISFLICVAVLAFLFGSIGTFLFYFAFGLFLWWWSHRFHLEGSRFLRSALSLGILIVFLYLFYWIFDDLMGLMVCIIYALSFVIGCVLYLFHTKRELNEEIHRSFPRTFLVVFYSHVMAFTAAALFAYALSYALFRDSFVSMIFIILAWLLPTLLLYFFLTKFLYLRFFDRQHIRRDLKKGLLHAIAYCAVFAFLIIMTYILTAFQFAAMEKESQEDTLSNVLMSLSNVEAEITEESDTNIFGLKVTQDIISFSEDVLKESQDIKASLKDSFGMDDYLSDNYFTLLAEDQLKVSGIAGKAYGITELRSDMVREYARLNKQESNSAFDDGTTSLAEHNSALAAYIDTNYVPYEDPFEFSSMRTRISASRYSYDALLSDGELLEFNAVYDPDMEILMSGRSRFSKRFFDVFYHTVVFRGLMVLVFNSILLQLEETIDPYTIELLYNNRGSESPKSSALRYRMIRSNHDATLTLAG